MDDVINRVLGAGIAYGAAKLAAVGVTLSPAAQMSLGLAVYGASHRAIDWLRKRFI